MSLFHLLDGTQPCATDPDRMFPELGDDATAGKVICTPCPFLRPCAEYALLHRVAGIWGGTSDKQRRQARKRLGIIPTPIGLGNTVRDGRKATTA